MGGSVWSALLCCVVAVCLRLSVCQRQLIGGELCQLPFEFSGTVYTDCMRFGGREWCFSESGFFGVCAEDTSVSAPVSSPKPLRTPPAPERPARVLEGEDERALDCCGLLAAFGFESTLPVLIIDTDGEAIPDEPKVDGTLCVCDPTQPEEMLHLIGVEIRGSTSARDFAKKSYAVETRDSDGADLDTTLLGFANGSDWVLYGPELDASMGMRNFLTMQLYRSTGHYASNTEYCEVFVSEDGRALSMRHYNGVYILMEKIKRSDRRVSIDKLSPDDDISGGYIFKYDNNNFDPGDQIFNSSTSGLSFIVTYPSKDNVQPASLDYLSSYLGELESALATGDRSIWIDYIDEASFVDMFLITELTKNPDGYRGSYYFHKSTGSVLFAGPPWDFNEAYGMCCGYPIEGYLNDGVSDGISGGSAISPNGWRYNICVQQRRCRVDPTDGVSFWFQILMEDPEFQRRVQERWASLRGGEWSTETVQSYFASVRQEIQTPVMRNVDRWSSELAAKDQFIDADVWEQEMSTMESWTVARLEWMDSALSTAPVARPSASVPAG